MKILITGATGLIGRELGKVLVQAGHQILVISRDPSKAWRELAYPCEVIEADLNQEACQDPLLDSVEAIIHLAGENVGQGRWTEERKKNIYQSRVQVTRNLFASLKPHHKLQVFLSASAIGIYGDRGDQILTESSSHGAGFLADVCEAWEDSVLSHQTSFSKTRFVILRTGVVLSSPSKTKGGALEKMVQPFRYRVGGALGSGQQWVSWIHLQDLVKIYLKAVEAPQIKGVLNAVSPEPVTNRQLSQAIAQTLGTWVGPSVPSFMLKALLGEMSALVLDSTRVEPKQLQKWGYSFEFSHLEPALRDCLNSK